MAVGAFGVGWGPAAWERRDQTQSAKPLSNWPLPSVLGLGETYILSHQNNSMSQNKRLHPGGSSVSSTMPSLSLEQEEDDHETPDGAPFTDPAQLFQISKSHL